MANKEHLIRLRHGFYAWNEWRLLNPKKRPDLAKADLSGASLNSADLTEANLQGANFKGADLNGAYLSWANLSGADLSWAHLKGANLNMANLIGAKLSNTGIYKKDYRGVVIFDESTVWDAENRSHDD
jgi:uncharacterized protein YjbI with pentapeptide repeats